MADALELIAQIEKEWNQDTEEEAERVRLEIELLEAKHAEELEKANEENKQLSFLERMDVAYSKAVAEVEDA